LAELGSPSETLDVLVSKSGRLTGAQTKAARPLKDGSLVRVHHGSSASPARLCLLDQKEITPGEEALAQLRFAAPVFAFVGDRFILRDWAEQATLGGGVVLDPDASSKRFRSAGQKRFLERMRCCWQSATESLEAELERQCVASSAGLLRKSAFSAQEIQQSLCKLGAAGKAILMGHLAAAQPWWEALRERAVSLIASEHKAHPEKGGLSVNQLRSVLGELPAPGVFEALLAELCKSGFTQSGPLIRQTAHRPALPPHLQAAGVRLRAELSNKPLEPPSRKELSADSASQQALRFLLDTGEAVELGEEVIILAESFTQALAVIKKFIGERGSATVSDLRQAVGTSRRIMVPLLEKLDREGITLRQGDRRILKERTVKK
jgi:selenocysteine-specific elongation factor